jgi:ComEC/Rec2-related protein
MKRVVNVRIPLFAALALCAGIAMGYFFAYYNIDCIYIISAVPVAAVFIIIASLFKNKISITLIICLICAIFCGGGIASFSTIESYSKSELFDGVEYNITATVCDKKTTSDSEYIIINKVKYNNISYDGKCVVYLNSDYGEFCDIGYTVSFSATVYRDNFPFPYGELNGRIQNNIKYYCSVYGGMKSTYHSSFFYSIRSAIRNTLYKNVDNDTASVIFAMLTGNTSDMDSETLTTFRSGGIAHIFAVSGLHIGIVYLILNFICKKLRLNKYLTTIISCGGILFYAGVCAFTISSVRATIMCTIASITRLIYCKYDSLNSLSLSIILILFINPMNLFNVGFQLSVCAVLGIILLNNKLNRLLHKLPKGVRTAITVSLSAQAGTMPVMLVNYGYLSGAGILLNILIIPVLSCIFIALFMCTILCTCITVLAPYVMPIAVLPMQMLLSFLIDAGFEKALIKGFGAGAFLLFYYLALTILSDKLNMQILYRILCFTLCLVLTVSYTLVRTYAPINGYYIAVSASYTGGAVIIKNADTNILVITNEAVPSTFLKFLNNNYATNITAIILLGNEDDIISFNTENVNCSDVYVCYQNIATNLTSFDIHYEKEFEIGGIEFEFADRYSLSTVIDGVKVGICAGEIPFSYCDILISQKQSTYCFYKQVVYFTQRCKKYNVYDYGNISYYLHNGKYKLLSLVPERVHI